MAILLKWNTRQAQAPGSILVRSHMNLPNASSVFSGKTQVATGRYIMIMLNFIIAPKTGTSYCFMSIFMVTTQEVLELLTKRDGRHLWQNLPMNMHGSGNR